MASSKQASDHLTALPLELLLKVVANTPISSFLALTQTSYELRAVIKTNAKEICNMAIEDNQVYCHLAELLSSKRIHGWLVPRSKAVANIEAANGRMMRLSSGVTVTYNLHIPLAAPGPQFLLFLERNHVTLQTAEGEAEESVRMEYWVYKSMKDEFNRRTPRRAVMALKDFLQEINGAEELRSKKQTRVIKNYGEWRPKTRDLIWYYGVMST